MFADWMFSKILLRRNISTQTMSVYLYDYCGSIISKVKENSAGAQLSRDILFHFWQKYFFS